MKNLKIVFTLIFASVAMSCSSDDPIIIDATDVQQVSNAAKAGTWYITSYMVSGVNKTTDYAGFSFDFADNGAVTATSSAESYNGTWSVVDSGATGNSAEVDFKMSFASPVNFEELSDDWKIVSINSNKIDLMDDSGVSGNIDTLTFEKN